MRKNYRRKNSASGRNVHSKEILVLTRRKTTMMRIIAVGKHKRIIAKSVMSLPSRTQT